jgi:hypothetical protein
VRQAAQVLAAKKRRAILQAADRAGVTVVGTQSRATIAVRVALKILGFQDQVDENSAMYRALFSCFNETAQVLIDLYNPKYYAGTPIATPHLATVREGVIRVILLDGPVNSTNPNRRTLLVPIIEFQNPRTDKQL